MVRVESLSDAELGGERYGYCRSFNGVGINGEAQCPFEFNIATCIHVSRLLLPPSDLMPPGPERLRWQRRPAVVSRNLDGAYEFSDSRLFYNQAYFGLCVVRDSLLPQYEFPLR